MPGSFAENKLASRDAKQTLAALLDAELFLKDLVVRLSRGTIQMESAEIRQWSGWAQSLRQEEAFEALRPALGRPEAWPEIWDRARESGFSAQTEHFHALFFLRLFEQTHEREDFLLSRYAFREALLSFRVLAQSDYLEKELRKADPSFSSEAIEGILKSLVDSPLEMIARCAQNSLHIHQWNGAPAQRGLRYCLELLQEGTEIFHDCVDHPVAQGILNGLGVARELMSQVIDQELTQRLEEIDLATTSRPDLLAIFDGAIRRHEAVHFPPALDRKILRRGLSVLWDLREMDREEELVIMPPMLERLTPPAVRLEELIEKSRTDQSSDAEGTTSLGMEGAVADLFVFRGEESLSIDDRERWYRRALKTCPDHRNASRMLSYLLIERANRELLKLSALPSATTRFGPLREPVEKILSRISALLEEAATLSPENDLLPQYREDLIKEQKRFQTDPRQESQKQNNDGDDTEENEENN